LRQMTQAHQPATPDVPLTASRAVRLAITRAADTSVGLSLTVLSVAEDSFKLDDLLAALSDDLLMVGLTRAGAVCGLMACDFQFAAATVEVRTMGVLSTIVPEARPVTGTDLKLTEPILQRVLGELELTTPRTVLDSWADGAMLSDRLDSVRKVGFELSDMSYRLIRVSVDLGVEGRQATLMIALPLQVQMEATDTSTLLDWDTHFQAAVFKSPARLDAVLHRFQMPLHKATNLEIGQTIPLPGCTVGSVRLEAPDGKEVARGRLGQIAGKIAVRLEDEAPAMLSEMPGAGGALGANGPAGMLGDAPMGMMGDAAGGLMTPAMGGMMDDAGEGGLPPLDQPMALNPDLALADEVEDS